MAPGDFFFNMNEAAIDFAKIMNGTSIYLDRELYAQILSVNIRGKQGYTYSFPIKGNQHSVYGRKRLTNFKVVADIHTHGAYSAGYDDNHFSGEMITINQTERTKTSDELKTSYSLTDGDIAAANKNQYISYLVTPNGSLKKYNPMSGKLSIIKSDIPGDLKDPTSNHIKSTNSFDLDSAINILTYRIKMLRYEK